MRLLIVWMLCVLIVLLPGCSALLPWLGGRDADVAAIEKELEGYKTQLTNLQNAVKQADTNADGKLSLEEGMVGLAGGILAAVTGTNVYRNRARKRRNEPL